MNELRGRNLAHVGCTIGLTLGLALGLVAALLIVTLVRGDSAINWATVAWFGLTFALGIVGYWALSGRFAGRAPNNRSSPRIRGRPPMRPSGRFRDRGSRFSNALRSLAMR